MIILKIFCKIGGDNGFDGQPGLFGMKGESILFSIAII
jgi:hypothetical protein